MGQHKVLFRQLIAFAEEKATAAGDIASKFRHVAEFNFSDARGIPSILERRRPCPPEAAGTIEGCVWVRFWNNERVQVLLLVSSTKRWMRVRACARRLR
jgi:hypothetical protein